MAREFHTLLLDAALYTFRGPKRIESACEKNVECLSSCVEIGQSVLLYSIKINNTVGYISRNTRNVTLRSATLRNYICLNTFSVINHYSYLL